MKHRRGCSGCRCGRGWQRRRDDFARLALLRSSFFLQHLLEHRVLLFHLRDSFLGILQRGNSGILGFQECKPGLGSFECVARCDLLHFPSGLIRSLSLHDPLHLLSHQRQICKGFSLALTRFVKPQLSFFQISLTKFLAYLSDFRVVQRISVITFWCCCPSSHFCRNSRF